MTDIYQAFTAEEMKGEGLVLKKGKKNFRKVIVKELPFTADLKSQIDSSCLHVRKYLGFQIRTVEQSPHPHKQS